VRRVGRRAGRCGRPGRRGRRAWPWRAPAPCRAVSGGRGRRRRTGGCRRSSRRSPAPDGGRQVTAHVPPAKPSGTDERWWNSPAGRFADVGPSLGR
jgi:hypothetical protein